MITWTKLPRHILTGNTPSKWEVQISYDHPFYPGCYGFTADGDGEGGGLRFALNADNRWELAAYDGMTDLPRSVVKTLKAAGFIVPEDF